MPGFVQLTSQVPRDSNDLPVPGTVRWHPERKIVWAECTKRVAQFDLVVFDMDLALPTGVPTRDLTSFDKDHPWNFVHPARTVYDQTEVFNVTYTLNAASVPWTIGETMDEDGAEPGQGTVLRVEETHNLVTDVRTGTMTYRETTAGFSSGDAVTGLTSGATGDLDTAPANHLRYMASLWTYGVAQSAGEIGRRIPVLTRGFTQVKATTGVAASQFLIPAQGLPEVVAKSAITGEPVMQVARSLNAGETDNLVFVLFNGERGIGSSGADE